MINRERQPYSPLPIDTYRKEHKDGDIYLIRALKVAGDYVEQAVMEERLPLELYDSASLAALSLTNSQCIENHKYQIQFPGITEDSAWEPAVHGLATPDELVGLLARRPELHGLELARLTHIGRWLGRSALQLPVLSSLEKTAKPETQLLVGLEEADDVAGADDIPAYYELWFDDPKVLVVTRKRVVAMHKGTPLGDDAVLRTIESSSMIIDRDALSVEMAEAFKQAVDIGSGKAEKEGNSAGLQPGAILHEQLEPIFQLPPESRPPSVRPYMTTYFTASTLPRYLRTNQIPSEDETTS